MLYQLSYASPNSLALPPKNRTLELVRSRFTIAKVTTGRKGSAIAAKNSQVRQRTLESSNVNPVTSVVEMITAQREVETMRRVLTMFSTELDKTAAQDLPRVG